MNWYLKILKNCISFKGRAGRKEFIFIPLFILLVNPYLNAVLGKISFNLYVFYVFISVIVFIAVLIRRLHDINRNAWWAFILFVPVVDLYALGVLLFIGGSSNSNKYGSSPNNWVEPPPSLRTLFILLAFCMLSEFYMIITDDSSGPAMLG